MEYVINDLALSQQNAIQNCVQNLKRTLPVFNDKTSMEVFKMWLLASKARVTGCPLIFFALLNITITAFKCSSPIVPY